MIFEYIQGILIAVIVIMVALKLKQLIDKIKD